MTVYTTDNIYSNTIHSLYVFNPALKNPQLVPNQSLMASGSNIAPKTIKMAKPKQSRNDSKGPDMFSLQTCKKYLTAMAINTPIKKYIKSEITCINL